MEFIRMIETRKHFTADPKIAILRRHLLENVAISAVCDEYGLQLTDMVFDTHDDWQLTLGMLGLYYTYRSGWAVDGRSGAGHSAPGLYPSGYSVTHRLPHHIPGL